MIFRGRELKVGDELRSLVWGVVKCIDTEYTSNRPILIENKRASESYTKKGHFLSDDLGDCVLFWPDEKIILPEPPEERKQWIVTDATYVRQYYLTTLMTESTARKAYGDRLIEPYEGPKVK